MKKLLWLFLLIGAFALPAQAQHRYPLATNISADGRTVYADYSARELSKPEPQIQITQEVVVDYQCVPNPGNPPPGLIRLYCDSTTGQLTCLTSTGGNACPGGGGGGGGGSVASVGLAGPTGIVISNSPVTSSGTLTWAMPSGWILGDLLVGNGSNSVARLAGPTTPNDVPQQLISTPASGVATLPQFAKAGLPGRTVSGTTDTILATDRSPKTVEYTSNSSVAVTVPDPGSTGFESNPAFITIVQGAGAVTFTPQTSAVIEVCNGATCFPGQTTFTQTTGQIANWSSPDGGNWLVRLNASGINSGNPLINNQCLSGCGVVWTGGLGFTVSASIYNIVSTTYSSPLTNLTLTTADPSNPRIDVIAVNTSGAAVVITGTPAASPSAPTVDPTTQLALTFVTVPAGSSTPTVSSILVYDENVGPATEWTCTPSSNFNCNSTSNPFHLTKDIEATTAANTNNVVLNKGSTVDLSTSSTFTFYIRNKASWPNQKSLSICFLNSATIVGQCVGFKNGVFGFNQAITTAYQQIVIPISAFALTGVVDRVRFQVVGGGGTIGFYLDWIQIQTTPVGSGNPGFQLQVNSQNTQPTANLKNSSTVTFTKTSNLSGVDDVTATTHANHAISFTIGAPGGTALSAASTTTDYISVPFACTINRYTLQIDAGTITVKFWKVALGTAIPTSSNSINTSGVGISSGTAVTSTTLSDFTTTSVAANDSIAMNVTAAATAAFVNGVLSCQE